MSNETIKGFFEFIEKSEDLQAQVKNAATSNNVVNIAASNGYNFSQQDLQNYMQENEDAQHLGIDELAGVAGGCGDHYYSGPVYQQQ